jgi:spectinomycin phosphotransferase
VHERPADISDARVAAALLEEWALAAAGLEYLPVGFGGYHWLATDSAGRRWFVTLSEVDAEGAFADLAAAMRTAAGLAAAGLGFVVAPLPSEAGPAVVRLGPRYAMALFPYCDGVPGRWGEPLTGSDRLTLIAMLAELHGVSMDGVPVRWLELANREVLDLSLRERGSAWAGGPYSEPARDLLDSRGPQLVRELERFDALTAEVAGDGRPLVITHGEPHPGNLVRAADQFLLVDWDTVGLAPPERDLWSILTASGAEAARYAELTGRPVSAAAIEFYRLRWALDDISLILTEFRSPHSRTADTDVSWAAFRSYLEALPSR